MMTVESICPRLHDSQIPRDAECLGHHRQSPHTLHEIEDDLHHVCLASVLTEVSSSWDFGLACFEPEEKRVL